MTVNTIDTTTPLVGLKAGAEVYNANFTDSNNAASKEVGILPDQVPTNSDLGTASTKDTGTASGEIPLNSDLGSASTKDSGTLAGEIPLNSDLGSSSSVDSSGSIWGAGNIESGSNANGQYWKYPNGMLICQNKISTSTSTNSTSTFPHAFLDTSYSLSPSHNDANNVILSSGGSTAPTASGFTWRVQDASGSFVSVSSAQYIAIGRWK